MLLVRLIFEYLLVLDYLQVYELHRLSFHDPQPEYEQETFGGTQNFYCVFQLLRFDLLDLSNCLLKRDGL
jgi:hypothetical protein